MIREWGLVARAVLPGVGQTPAGPLQDRIAAPGFAEDGPAIGLENAANLRKRQRQIQVMQNGVAPDSVEGSIGKG